MRLRVIHAEALTKDIRLIRLAATDGTPLAAFQPGAHIELNLPLSLPLGRPPGDGPALRKYSLVSDGEQPTHYDISVKRAAQGRGGSAWLHDGLAVGDELEVSAPIHEFGLAPEGTHHVLVAGGIGITPLLGMASRLKREGASYELHYSGANPEGMAFREALVREHGERIHLTFTRDTGSAGSRMPLQDLLARHHAQPDTHVYVCGPGSLIDAVRLAADSLGMGRHRIHFESFGPSWSATDGPVRLAMAASGMTLEVPPGTTLLDAMEAAGAWIPSDCKRGECGACIASYGGGRPIHRDHCLTEAQRQHSICPCVSWASSDEVLTLQL